MGLESGSDNGKDFMSLLNTFKSEDLYFLFCDKENIETEIAEIKGSNIDENRKKLLEEFGLEKEKLFESFYNYYGDYDIHQEILAKFLKSQPDCDKTYGDMGSLYDLIMDADKILHEKLYRIIFDTIGKDDIVSIISGQNLEVDKLLSRVPIMVKHFFDVRNNNIRNILKRCIQDSPYFLQIMNNPNYTIDDYINQFINYYEENTLNYINQKFENSKFSKNYNFVNHELKFGKFDEFLAYIDMFLLDKFSPYLVFEGFLGFCTNKIDSNGASEKISSESHSASNVYGIVYGFFDEIFPGSQREDILEGLDFVKITKDSFAKNFEVLGKILKNLKIRNNGAFNTPFNALDIKKIEYAEQLFQKNKGKIFPQLKEYFFNEVSKFLFNRENFQLSLDLDDIISDLRKKYEHAKPHIGDVSKKQRDEMEKTFLANEKDKFRAKFFDTFPKYSNFFDSLELKEFFAITELFMSLLSDAKIIDKEKLNKDYKNFVKTTLEEKFKKSHNNAKPKQPVVPVVKKRDKSESDDRMQSSPNIVIEKKKLPEGLISDLEKYFGGKLDPKLARSLRNSFGEYKTSWYTKEKYGFDFDDEFFEILHKHGFVCIDDITQSTQKIVDSQPDILCEVNDIDSGGVDIQTSKAYELLGMIDTLSSIEEKIDIYVEILKELGFFFYKNEGKIRGRILELSKSNSVFFTAFGNFISGIVHCTQLPEKKEKKWGTYPVYCYDIGTSGYRLVTLYLGNGVRTAIFDIMPHTEYEKFLDKKCNG